MAIVNRIVTRAARPAFLAARSPIGVRFLSTPVEPKEKANSIINALPGNSLISKTSILATSAAAAVYGISNELLVIHDETILVCTFAAFTALCAKFIAPLYTEWADGEIKKVNDLLNGSRSKHVSAVKNRIESVSQLKDVVATTKQLFEVSRETAKLEAEAFELKQKLAVAHEAKATLDSWVRFEQQQRQLEQEQLIKSVLDKVNKEIGNPKFQEKVLAESVAEVEKIFSKA
ncbi:ATP synthase subunit 4, mitochondrial [Clavispora lusitaniae]|uniref:ATP synthase subunit 4 n=1 Tax=Clavispora lusitaniae TaxID=36911 RepID=A0AA91T1Y2_CLALS|nr:atp4 subunit B of the stator stalk of mitochondrial F1F0 ATP synthase [Clavispora lusitaniae]KAF7580137.1 ATP synthase subunit 4, mitochondrial [Clavispora lusitaniae]OVF08793.1 putative F1F0 ATP synthase subunit [Clavispora lusitaniae]